MSGFVNHVLQNGNEKITSNYGNREFYIRDELIKDFHYGIDMIDKTMKYDYIIAFEDGEVISCRDSIKGYDSINKSGNFVEIKHDNNYMTRYLHMAYGTVLVKVGDKVKKGDVLGYIGGTGYVTGAHVHFAIKKDNEYVNPYSYFMNEKRIKSIDVLGIPVLRDITKSQIEVNINNLYVRDKPNGNILGYITKGIYDILNKKTDGDYTWYEIGEDMWIAGSSDWSIVYNLENEIIEESNYKLIYECIKDGMYAIELYKGEKLYLVKDNK